MSLMPEVLQSQPKACGLCSGNAVLVGCGAAPYSTYRHVKLSSGSRDDKIMAVLLAVEDFAG